MKSDQIIFIYKCGHQSVVNAPNGKDEFGADENGVVDCRNEYCDACEDIYVTKWSTGVPKWKFSKFNDNPKKVKKYQ